jgi:hypothetical protein
MKVAGEIDDRAPGTRADSRYPTGVRVLAATAAFALVLAAGCSGKSTGAKSPTAAKPTAPGDAGATPPKRPPPPVEGVACSDGPCMVHPGSGNHHECLNAAAGVCFQFGRRCFPTDKCVPDAAGVYRSCDQVGEGSCLTFGVVCEPARRCAFDPATRTYRTCEKLDAGKCSRYGATCEPAPAS